jgi:hypothetical protein
MPIFHEGMNLRHDEISECKNYLCLKSFDECARYIIATDLDKSHIPGDLLPFDRARAKEILCHKVEV